MLGAHPDRHARTVLATGELEVPVDLVRRHVPLDHLDEFTVALHDSAGWYRSFPRESVQVEVQDPRAAHEALLSKYTDNDMHNVLAYLETLK